MIKDLEVNYLDQVMDIWLKTNISAHKFIRDEYWKNNYEFVKQILPTSKVKIFIEDGIIKGFMGMVDDYVAGLFVPEEYQGQGIGKQLLEECKSRHKNLLLDVYVENEQAVGFYKRNGFEIVNEKENEDTKKSEYSMVWSK